MEIIKAILLMIGLLLSTIGILEYVSGAIYEVETKNWSAVLAIVVWGIFYYLS